MRVGDDCLRPHTAHHKLRTTTSKPQYIPATTSRRYPTAIKKQVCPNPLARAVNLSIANFDLVVTPLWTHAHARRVEDGGSCSNGGGNDDDGDDGDDAVTFVDASELARLRGEL